MLNKEKKLTLEELLQRHGDTKSAGRHQFENIEERKDT